MTQKFFAALFLFTCGVFAQQPASTPNQDPSRQIAESAIQRHQQWMNARVPLNDGSPLPNKPSPSIYRWMYDVTGDGVDELFLSSSMDSQRNILWNVYAATENGYRQTASNVLAGPRGLFRRTESGPVELISYARLNNGDDYGIAAYRFQPDGSVVDLSRTLNEEEREAAQNREERAKRFGTNHPVIQNIEEANSEAILANQPNWRPFDREQPPSAPRYWTAQSSNSAQMNLASASPAAPLSSSSGFTKRNPATQTPLAPATSAPAETNYRLWGLLAAFAAAALAAGVYLLMRSKSKI